VNRAEVEKILKENGFIPTVSVPKGIIDFQRRSIKNYNRIILYPIDLIDLTPEKLKELMDRRL
jgi:hypothetical protein